MTGLSEKANKEIQSLNFCGADFSVVPLQDERFFFHFIIAKVEFKHK